MMDAYNETLLRYAFNVARRGKLDSPAVSASARSRLCGSTISVDMDVEGDLITDFAQQVDACSFGAAAASIVASDICGATLQEVADMTSRLRHLVTNHGDGRAVPEKRDQPPASHDSPNQPIFAADGNAGARWRDLECLAAVVKWPARIPSALLIADALDTALHKLKSVGRSEV